jgi:hypothetical protein
MYVRGDTSVKYVAKPSLHLIQNWRMNVTHAEKIKKIVRILKKNFPNSNMDTARIIYIGYLIVEALEEPASKVEIKPDERIS